MAVLKYKQDGVWKIADSLPDALNGTTDPTSSTVARYVGQLYMNTTSGEVFACQAISQEGTYTWKSVTGYEKPQTGIPKTDLASDVQTSLGAADTAEQVANKSTTITAESTHTQYPTSKAVYDDVFSQLNEDKADRADVLPLINIWDEQWELGIYDNSTGQKTNSSYNIRSKNRIEVKSNTKYFVNFNSNGGRIHEYTSSGGYIRNQNLSGNTEITTHSNCAYITFHIGSEYGTTYNHNISINYPSTYHGYYPSALPRTNAHVGGLGNVIGMRGWNQLVKNGNFADTSDWRIINVSFSVSNNIGTILASYKDGQIQFTLDNVTNHKIYIKCEINLTTATDLVQMAVITNSGNTAAKIVSAESKTGWQELSATFVANYVNTTTFAIRDRRTSGFDSVQIRNVMYCDLTAMGLDGINDPKDFKAMFPSKWYPYCSGSFGDLLWENASPTSSFGAQDITIDFTKYSSSVVVYFVSASGTDAVSSFINKEIRYYYPNVMGEDGINAFRPTMMLDNKMTFATGRKNATYGARYTNDNNLMIPYKIYGIR